MTRQRTSVRAAYRAPIAAAAGLGLACLAAAPIAAQTAGETTTFESRQFRYAVALPGGCRHQVGPGTTDAVCSPDFDPEKSAVASAAGALVLSVTAEAVTDGDAAAARALPRHSEAAFKKELPASVCGESDKARVKIESLDQAIEEGRVVYSADVLCAAVRFLQLGPRRAMVRQVIGPDTVYRLLARAPVEEFEKQRGIIDAFFASFRMLPSAMADKQAGK